MTRFATIFLLATAVAVTSTAALAETATVAHRRAEKGPRSAKPAVARPAPVGGINTPSTDFSKVERADEEPSERNGSTLHPTMGAGGMGLGAGF